MSGRGTTRVTPVRKHFKSVFPTSFKEKQRPTVHFKQNMIRYLTRCLFAWLVFFSASCVSRKKMTYLGDQKPDVAIKNAAAKSYALKEAEYKLRPGDVLSVKVYSLTQDKFNFIDPKGIELTLTDEGTMELPVVGIVKLAGKTVKDTKEELKKLIREYLKDPVVDVRLKNFRFTVLGEVENQGVFTAATLNSKLTILEAIGMAGGLTDYSERSRIRVIRHEKSRANIYYIDLTEDNALLSESYYIHPDDTIVVDPLGAKSFRTQQLTTATLILSAIGTLGILFIRR